LRPLFVIRVAPSGRCLHCEVAAMLAARLGTGPSVTTALAHAYERWDGGGFPEGLAGEAVPLAVRVTVVARDAELWWRAGPAETTEVLGARRGRAYDPAVVDAYISVGAETLADLDATDAWAAMLAAAPGDDEIADAAVDTALGAVADFTDLKSPWTRGHSPRAAALAGAAAHEVGMAAEDVARLSRAALLQDLGRVGVPNGIWDRAGPLGVAERRKCGCIPT
jgi:response regulator RpfG family c-di-GMP phosphodiesterase